MKMDYQYILVLGSNLGNKKEHLQLAIDSLRQRGITLEKETAYLATAPAMVKTQPDFINQGVRIRTDLPPENLLELVKDVEKTNKRSTTYRYGPREIDIDIAWWSSGDYRSSRLQIPHPGNYARSWVREIMAELLPENSPKDADYKTMNVKSISSIQDFRRKKLEKEKIVMLTAYDYSMAKILARTSVDVLLVGDSLGNVFQGADTTLGVSIEHMIYHGRAVRRGAVDKFLIIDMPFLSYHTSADKAVENAGRIIQETGANAVKLEGGRDFLDVIKKIIRAGIPVMGHLGLMPQSVLRTGGYKLQAKDSESRKKLIEDAKALQAEGVFAIVLEMVPAEFGGELAREIEIPVIGIGAGADVDGQVLVINDLLGFDAEFSPKFARKYMNAHDEILKSIELFSRDVRVREYPNESEGFSHSGK